MTFYQKLKTELPCLYDPVTKSLIQHKPPLKSRDFTHCGRHVLKRRRLISGTAGIPAAAKGLATPALKGRCAGGIVICESPKIDGMTPFF